MRVVSDGEWICHNTWPQHGLKLPVQVVTMSGRVLLDLTEDGLWWPGDPFVITSTLTSVSHTLPPPSPPRLTVTRLTTLTGPESWRKSVLLGCGTVLPSLRVAVKMRINITVARLVYTK